jgi:hypothetical protein
VNITFSPFLAPPRKAKLTSTSSEYVLELLMGYTYNNNKALSCCYKEETMKTCRFAKSFFAVILGIAIVGVSACGGSAPTAPAATQPPAAATEPPTAATEAPAATESPSATQPPASGVPECKKTDTPNSWDCSRDARQIIFNGIPEGITPLNMPIEADSSNPLEIVSIAAKIEFQNSSGAPVTSFENPIKLELSYTDNDVKQAGDAGLRPVYITKESTSWLDFTYVEYFAGGASIKDILKWNDQTIGWGTPRQCVQPDPSISGMWNCSNDNSPKIIFYGIPPGIEPKMMPIDAADWDKEVSPLDGQKSTLISIVANIVFYKEGTSEPIISFDKPIILEFYFTDQDAINAGDAGLRPIYLPKDSPTWLDFPPENIEYIDNGAKISNITEWSDQPTGWGTPK